MFLSANSNILISFNLLIFVLIRDFISLSFCIPGNFWLDARHEFYLVRCWIFLYCYKYSWALFWDVVTLLGSSLILLSMTEPCLIKGGYWGKTLPWTLPCVPWIMKFPHLAGESRHSHSWVSLGTLPPFFEIILSWKTTFGSLLTCMHWSMLSRRFKESLCRCLAFSCSVALFSLVLCPAN